jgi:hypothetical protein
MHNIPAKSIFLQYAKMTPALYRPERASPRLYNMGIKKDTKVPKHPNLPDLQYRVIRIDSECVSKMSRSKAQRPGRSTAYCLVPLGEEMSKQTGRRKFEGES